MAGRMLIAALLLSSAQARTLQVSRGALNVPLQPARQSSQVTKTCSNLVSDLWADLVINADNEGPEDKVNFEKADTKVKEQWATDCMSAFDVHEGSKDAVGKVVEDDCATAGGTPSHCTDMRKSWWKACEEKKLGPWCDSTFDWFAKKTKPKCLSKCNAYLCKARCNAQDKVNELSDKIKAYRIKVESEIVKEKRLEKAAEDQKDSIAARQKLDTEMCSRSSKNVTALEGSQKSMIHELGVLSEASRTAADDKDKTFDILKKVQAQKDVDKKQVSDAQADWDAAAAKYKEARAKQVAKNKEAVDMQGEIASAVVTKKFKCEKAAEFKKNHEASQKADNEVLEEIRAEKLKLQKAMDKLIALRATIIADEITLVNTTGNNGAAYCSAYCAYNWNSELPTHFKGACCANAFNTLTGEKMPCTAQTPVPAPPPPPQALIVNTVGNNGDAYCSAYCAYNWNSEMPSYFKGACCLKAIAVNTGEEIACNAYNPGQGTTCSCQQQDNTPFLTSSLDGGNTDYACDGAVLHDTVSNNGDAYCSAYCAYNWNNEMPSDFKGACCLKAVAVNTGEEISCTAMNSGLGTTCTCQQQDDTPFLTGGDDASNENYVCSGAVPQPPTPAPPPPPPAPVPRAGITCECQQQDSSPFLTGSQNPTNENNVCTGPPPKH